MTFSATGRSTAHTKCRNEVKDLERSVKLCGRAVADNQNEAGNNQTRLSPDKDLMTDAILTSGISIHLPKESK